MKRKSIAGPVIATVVGGVFVLIALVAAIGAAAASSDPYGDTATSAGNYAGVVVWGIVGVAALYWGIRGLIRHARADDSRR